MGRILRVFFKREDGVVAVIFAVMAIPFIAMAGWAVDYLRLQHVKERLQIEADAAALNALITEAQWEVVRDAAKAEIERTYQSSWAHDVKLTGGWLNSVDFRVVAEADVPLAFMNILPGIGDTQHIAAVAVARVAASDPIYPPPTFASLDPEAYDFNRIWLYCYWPDRPDNDSSQPKRTQMVPIADNAGSVFTADPGNPREADNPIQDSILRSTYDQLTAPGNGGLDSREQGVWRQISGGSTANRTYTYLMPQCPYGSHLSFRLENVRDALHAVRQGTGSPARWDSGGTRYNYYTDTKSSPGEKDNHTGITSYTILETIICDTLEQCRNTPQNGGLIPPRQTGRAPQEAAEGCSPGSGRYMYYGWEDRPPELGGSDRDYDDIRIVMACPEEGQAGTRNVRLIL